TNGKWLKLRSTSSRPFRPEAYSQIDWNRAGSAGGLAMSKMSGRRSLTTILSLLTLGAALSFGLGKAVAADDVTEDQIVRALAPKKPLTRGLSSGPQADPAAIAAEGRFVQTIRGRAQTRSSAIWSKSTAFPALTS